jgi:hypothetical protein
MTSGGALVNSFAQLVITAPVTEHFPATRFFTSSKFVEHLHAAGILGCATRQELKPQSPT